MIGAVAMLAHQGGWDEILWVAAPIAIIFGALQVAKRRAEAQGVPQAEAAHDAPDDAQ